MAIMQENYFNDKTWVNFGDAGVGVLLKNTIMQLFTTRNRGKIV
jgi:hypothetical protein